MAAEQELRYFGHRTEGPGGLGTRVVAVQGEDTRELPLRLDLWNHSPDGFEWGYGGSGPAQLALAILADATGDDHYARVMHQPFKRQVIGRLERDQFTLTAAQVRDWVAEHPIPERHRFDPEEGRGR